MSIPNQLSKDCVAVEGYSDGIENKIDLPGIFDRIKDLKGFSTDVLLAEYLQTNKSHISHVRKVNMMSLNTIVNVLLNDDEIKDIVDIGYIITGKVTVEIESEKNSSLQKEIENLKEIVANQEREIFGLEMRLEERRLDAGIKTPVKTVTKESL